MPDERRQLGVLYRDFLSRMVDLELISPGGEMDKLLGQLVAILAALSLVFAVMMAPRYFTSTLPRAVLMERAWGDEEFLIATTMAIAGLFAVLAWNVVLPDRRESLVLAVLPVRPRTVALAKVAAIATALGIATLAVNIFTGLAFPFVAAPAEAGMLGVARVFAAYWIAQMLAGAMVWGGLLAVQGVLAATLSCRLFPRISNGVQLAAFFGTLGAYFLQPPFSTAGFRNWAPSYWFFGLFQTLSGTAVPQFRNWAARAGWGLAAVFAVAAVSFGCSYGRHLRRMVEQSDISPSGARTASRLAAWAAGKMLRRPIDRAIVLFTARGLARSREHRLLVAAYAGVGLAIALAYAKDLLYHSGARWDRPNLPLLAASLALVFFAVVGTRAVFTLPIAPRGNWIFRITAVHSPAAYFAAARKALFAVSVWPSMAVFAVGFAAIWPPGAALRHVLLLATAACLVAEIALHRFVKLPFACSYLPGKANLNVKIGIYLILLLFLGDGATRVELWTLERDSRFAVLLGIVLAWTLWARRRTVTFAALPHHEVQFEDLPPQPLEIIDLHKDGTGTGERRYLDDGEAWRTLSE